MIRVDTREPDLARHLPGAVQEPLDVGDAHVYTDNVLFIFERKTVADWAASIKDGRWREQKVRLLATSPPHRIAYLIEGRCPTEKQHGLEPSVFTGALLSSQFRDGVHVIFTNGVEDSARWILELSERVMKDPAKWECKGGGSEWLPHVKTKKKKIENIDEATCYLLQLCQIPGISQHCATAIAGAYPNMIALIAALQSNPTTLFAKLPLIGPKKTAAMVKFLGIL